MSGSQSLPLVSVPVGGEVDRDAVFGADSPRDLTPIEVGAVAILEAWADTFSHFPPFSREVTGQYGGHYGDGRRYSAMLCLVSEAMDAVHRSLCEVEEADGGLLNLCYRRLEAAQRIREGVVRCVQ